MAEDPKRAMRSFGAPAHFTVDSKWEDWVVDWRGNILSHGTAKSSGRPHWRNVKKFDAEGYKKRTGNYPTGVINIYDISYWQHDGSKISSPYEMRSFMGGPRRAQESAGALQAPHELGDSREINKGQCKEWANRVAELCPEAEAEDPKRMFRDRPRRHDIAAFSGSWVTDRDGNVVSFTPERSVNDDVEARAIEHYERITKFDFKEYMDYWGDLPRGLDISDVSYWLDDGTYHKADEQYRQDIKTGGIAR